MTRRRTTVFAEEEDLAILRAAARRQGVSEAELIREAIHLAAMANRSWDRPFFTRTHRPRSGAPQHDGSLDDAWAEEVEAYRRSKAPAP